MTTTIKSNGSKWAGQEPDSVEKLLSVLSEYTLDPTFEDYGNFIQFEPELVSGGKLDGLTRFFGNFYRLSHVFNIDTSDKPTIKALTDAIRANQATPDYSKAKSEVIQGRIDRKAAEAKRIADAKRWRVY